ncbi:MAG: DUF2061 domain-containing protein [Candidatus Omnitrophica bacterium]|nr:DUF2061 domain-containing protein [Candidatus Omnitrophota bacterium]MBU1128059.1 DUF2061 domain-containing protein [Candidatus Omnitrophota bacterium]MBU1851058.1 DUF2061 domain-containing protein [Candidatus Omnitrophota bacterium]
MEHPKRSFVKSVTWRIVATLTTMIAVYAYSRNLQESLVVGIGANLIKFFLYYMHERIWDKTKFGRTEQPEYQI